MHVIPVWLALFLKIVKKVMCNKKNIIMHIKGFVQRQSLSKL